MIDKINKRLLRRNGARGQTALILILLTAATLIFLAITLNWGRIAQIKALITVAADQSASLLASDTASYGEMQKQTYLNDTNQIKQSTSVFVAIIMVVIAIIVTVFTIWNNPELTAFAWGLLIASIAMSVLNLVLQVVVVQPGITSLWNSLQKDQPVQQQFFEQGISTALQGSVTDQVKITDYFDSNANGIFGVTHDTANDTISRFAFFYTERLKMLNNILPPIPQVVLFYNQLGELMNGETCDENASDVSLGLGIAANPICGPLNCTSSPANPVCTEKIPGSFQLNDACTSSNPFNTTTYNPYCDPCCQPQFVPGSSPPVPLRPISCASDAECATNNPYGGAYLDIYDPSFQNYTEGISFLDLFGRDQQMGAFANLTPDVMSPVGVTPISEFPNGIYPFFWEMSDYSPRVDNINPSGPILPSQYHWCVAGSATGGGPIPVVPTPSGFPDLAQLELPYACSGADCCVNQISTSAATFTSVTSAPATITITAGPTVVLTTSPSNLYFPAGANYNIISTATDPSGTITNITLLDSTGAILSACPASPCAYSVTNALVGTETVNSNAIDNSGVLSNTASITINVIQAPTVSITNPSGGSIIHGTVVNITGIALAPQTGDTIASVTLSYKGTPLAPVVFNAATGSFSYAWTVPGTGPGSYTLTAVATDAHGLTATSSVTGLIS